MKTKNKAPKHCAACGHVPTVFNPLVLLMSGTWVHSTHTTDPRSGFYKAK